MKYLKKIFLFTLFTSILLSGILPAYAADMKEPRLLSVTVTDQVDRDGNDIKYLIEVSADDDISGINHITIQFKNLSNDRSVNKILYPEDFNGEVYTGWVKINAYEPEGSFTLYKVTLTDNAGNYKVYCRISDIDPDNEADKDKLELPNSAKIKLKNRIKNLDEIAPELIEISASPIEAAAETEVKLMAQIKDEGGSGIDYVKARFENLSGHGITINLDPENGCYAGTVSEIQTKHAGTYVLDQVMIKDNAGNRSVYKAGSGVLENGLQFVITE